jgi:hypothetical protein
MKFIVAGIVVTGWYLGFSAGEYMLDWYYWDNFNESRDNFPPYELFYLSHWVYSKEGFVIFLFWFFKIMVLYCGPLYSMGSLGINPMFIAPNFQVNQYMAVVPNNELAGTAAMSAFESFDYFLELILEPLESCDNVYDLLIVFIVFLIGNFEGSFIF